MRRARTAFQWKDVSAERPCTPARAGVAVIEGGVISFVRADHIGRPVFSTNAAGVKVWTATYQPFGEVHVSTGTLPTNRFPGQWFQSESGLHQNWMRDYDPTTGRYLQADPLGLVDGASVYGYVKQNPGRFIDPLGLAARPNFPRVPGGLSIWLGLDECGNPLPELVGLKKEICNIVGAFLCSLISGLDGDPNTNSRAGTNPHNNPTNAPSERNYSSQPYDPPKKGGGPRPGGGGGGGCCFDPWDTDDNTWIPDDPMDID